ncbi:hypothetical protein HOU02_gp064 [Caulobacter phage CcrBL9]|uniref:Uncharacterized protein n=1 Tax=Caulobacter phage CcrBL9 TaxID=2283270 RepID=A0A385EEB6_9CAUD|nr:hypothetical protein HOU02_gp064 [Caulobacter phage CcrBL9]AXQ69088.1 hypothetical protein CcrBL9_gp064c [Caulobacter phage CcrBL9]
MKTINLRFEDAVGLDDSSIEVSEARYSDLLMEGSFYVGDGNDLGMSEDYWGQWYIHGYWVDNGEVWWLLAYEPAPDEDGYEDIGFDNEDEAFGFGRDW